METLAKIGPQPTNLDADTLAQTPSGDSLKFNTTDEQKNRVEHIHASGNSFKEPQSFSFNATDPNENTNKNGGNSSQYFYRSFNATYPPKMSGTFHGCTVVKLGLVQIPMSPKPRRYKHFKTRMKF